MLRRESPVARFVVLVLLILALLLFAAKGLMDQLSERARRYTELHSDARILADQLAASLALPVWNFDQPQLDKIAGSALHNRQTAAVLIRAKDASDNRGFRIFGLARDDLGNLITLPGGTFPPLTGTLTEERPIIADGQPVGSIQVFLTPRYVEQDLRDLLFYQLATFIAFAAVLAASLYFLLWRIVLRPLRLIEQYASQVSSGGSANLTGRFRGELERLRASLEKMVDLLATRYGVVQSSERQFRTFIQQAPVPILLVPSPDGSPIYFNPAFTRTFGFSHDDLKTPDDWWPLIYPNPAYRATRRAAWEQTVARARQTGDFQDAQENEMTTKSGHTRFAQVRVSLVEGYRMSFLNDLTERRQAESALRLNQYAVDHNPVMIFRLDMDGCFLYANDAACTQLGYSPAEILHLHLWDVAETASLEQWPSRAARLREQWITSLESVCRAKSGENFPVEIRIQYVEFSGDQHFFVYANDITDRKHAQESQFAYTRRIQKLATELTRSEERQRREFAAILHDEVGQNLFAAATQLLAIRTQPGGPHEQIEKALALIDQITRDTRQLTFDLCPPVLYQLGLVPALQRLAEQFATRYSFLCTVAGDTAGPVDLNTRGLAYQTVRELLNNAAKHAHAKSVTITAAEIDHQVQIQVTDDGVGFNPAALRPGDGGFGLFHLRERIDLLGGTFKIDSAPHSGTRVQFTLPLNISQPTE